MSYFFLTNKTVAHPAFGRPLPTGEGEMRPECHDTLRVLSKICHEVYERESFEKSRSNCQSNEQDAQAGRSRANAFPFGCAATRVLFTHHQTRSASDRCILSWWI